MSRDSKEPRAICTGYSFGLTTLESDCKIAVGIHFIELSKIHAGVRPRGEVQPLRTSNRPSVSIFRRHWRDDPLKTVGSTVTIETSVSEQDSDSGLDNIRIEEA